MSTTYKVQYMPKSPERGMRFECCGEGETVTVIMKSTEVQTLGVNIGCADYDI